MDCKRCNCEIDVLELLPWGKAYRFDLNEHIFELCAACVSELIFVIEQFIDNQIVLTSVEDDPS